MAAEWIDVQHEDTLTRIAMLAGYSLTVFGSDNQWLWFIDLNGRSAGEGTATDLASATAAAEDAAYRLAAGSRGEAGPRSS